MTIRIDLIQTLLCAVGVVGMSLWPLKDQQKIKVREALQASGVEVHESTREIGDTTEIDEEREELGKIQKDLIKRRSRQGRST